MPSTEAGRAREPLFVRSFVLLAAANLLHGLSFNLFLHFPGFLTDLGANEVQIGQLYGLLGLTAIAIRPALGRRMDLQGRRPILLAGNALQLLGVALYLTLDSYGPWAYFVRMLHGAAEATLFTVLFTLAADIVPAGRRNEGLMLFGVSSMLPIALGGMVGDLVLAWAGYRELFLVALGFAVLGALACLPIREARPEAAPDGARTPSGGFWKVLRQRDLLPLWWISLVFASALAAVFTFLKTYTETRGLGSVGSFFAAYCTTAIGLRAFLGWLPDRIGVKRVLFPALLILALGFAALAGAETDAEVLVAGALCGVGHGYSFPLLFGLVVGRARDHERGSAMAILTSLVDAGYLVGPALGILIAQVGYSGAFRAVAIAVVIGTALFAWVDQRR
ncbi:MAG: MFS transporter [Proteobacteria bacterium]|nr:MFS transporter [Pseudomonadota bacterium]